MIDSQVAEARPGWKLPALPTAVIAGAGCVPVTTRVIAMDAGLPVAPAAVPARRPYTFQPQDLPG